jgi:hypothetical protein
MRGLRRTPPFATRDRGLEHLHRRHQDLLAHGDGGLERSDQRPTSWEMPLSSP